MDQHFNPPDLRRKLLEASPEFRAAWYFLQNPDEEVCKRGWDLLVSQYGDERAMIAWTQAAQLIAQMNQREEQMDKSEAPDATSTS